MVPVATAEQASEMRSESQPVIEAGVGTGVGAARRARESSVMWLVMVALVSAVFLAGKITSKVSMAGLTTAVALPSRFW